MKRALAAVLTAGVLVAGSASVASAQAIRWNVGGGLLLPMGDYGTFDKLGWIVNGGGTYWLTGNQVGIRGDLSYSQTTHDGFSGNTKIIGGMASALYALGPAAAPARPFVSGGLGLYNVKESVTGVSESKVAFGLGAGVTFKLGTGGTSLMVGTRFTSVSTSGSATTFLPIAVNLTFGK